MKIINKLVDKGYRTYLGAWFSITSRRPIGTNVFEKDWDVLAILDTCRVDALQSVAPEYDWLPEDEIKSILSLGSSSPEWMANTFTDQYFDKIRNTAFIACNAYARKIFEEGFQPDEKAIFKVSNWSIVSKEDFSLYHCVWNDVPVRQLGGHTDPRVTTDRALDAISRVNPEHAILHYQRPHHPYSSRALRENREELYSYEEKPFKELKNSNVNEGQIWDLYLDELRVVLDEIEYLRQNVNGTLAISADHGEAFGEYRVYGHPLGIMHPKVRRVPWIEVPGKGCNSQADIQYRLPEQGINKNMIDTKDQLKQLGYLN